MKRIPLPIVIFALLVAIVAGGPLVFPYSKIQPRLETYLGQLLKGKVTLSQIHFSYSPKPVFALEQVIIDSQESARIGRIEIPITTHNILKLGKKLRDIRVQEAVFSRQFALSLPDRLTPLPGSMHLDQVNLENIRVKLEQGEIGPLSGILNFKPEGQVENLTIRSSDEKLDLQIQPAEPGSFAIQLSAKDWKLPFAWPVQFEYINLTGKADNNALQVTDIRAGLYNGQLTGRAQLLWQDRWKLTGQIQAKNLHAEPLVSVFSPATRFSGVLNGEGAFRYEADGYAKLFDNPLLQGRFAVQDGVLRNIDLISPLKSPALDAPRHGGQTIFNSMSANFAAQGKIVSLRSISLESGKFRADGELTIREGSLSGGAATTLSAGAVAASNRIRLTGALNDPELRSDGAWRPKQEDAPAFVP